MVMCNIRILVKKWYLRRVSLTLNLFWDAHWLYIRSSSFDFGTTQLSWLPTSNSVQLTRESPQKRIKQKKNGYEALKGKAIFGFSRYYSVCSVCGFLVPKSGSVLWEMMGLATLDLKRDLKLKMKFVNEEEGEDWGARFGGRGWALIPEDNSGLWLGLNCFLELRLLSEINWLSSEI